MLVGAVGARTPTLTFILDTLTHLLVQAGEQCVQYKGKCLRMYVLGVGRCLCRARKHRPPTDTDHEEIQTTTRVRKDQVG